MVESWKLFLNFCSFTWIRPNQSLCHEFDSPRIAAVNFYQLWLNTELGDVRINCKYFFKKLQNLKITKARQKKGPFEKSLLSCFRIKSKRLRWYLLPIKIDLSFLNWHQKQPSTSVLRNRFRNRSIHRCSTEKGAVKNFAQFTEEHLCKSPFFIFLC